MKQKRRGKGQTGKVGQEEADKEKTAEEELKEEQEEDDHENGE